ncbi:MAG: hypothetical protein H6Q26_2556 [Bacteroidetes bacterium]|uniref:hypothetical protein n=1 Tax=Chitinophaga TaxID=79328 RepID=UPI001D41FBC3|nr:MULTISPECIES: hypothetical protein [Chitinophaga]MBP1652399.1 hypothetical protein [Bacteroidota bacterium]WPQ63940.1 hypothetical protein SIO70_03585 [Chitinophaga sancti]WPV68386.1 hypothetical protein QQL36_06620 [Chitinophaga sp. LS1]
MTDQQHLSTLSDIKRIMDRSSRFISLSGLSGVCAGIAGLLGAAIADVWISEYYNRWNTSGIFVREDFNLLKIKLTILGLIVMGIALAGGIYFTWRKANKDGASIFGKTSRNVFYSGLIPMVAGAAFIAGMVYNNFEVLVAPACLLFYGLALVNASKYTFRDIKYFGIAQIILGIINVFYLRRGLYFWALGFGVLHIVYGVMMWWKYERNAESEE